ncbi:MAG: beta-lactamase hydrolase domain-containing protein [Phycisphaerales bacterium JB061]
MRQPTILLVLAATPIILTGCSFNLTIHETETRPATAAHTVQIVEPAPAPKPIDPPTIFADGRYHFSAQPDEGTLESEIQDKGVTTVVNFRRDSEMESVPFDEAELINDLGATYVHIPLGGGVGDEPGYDPEDVDRLAEVLENAEGNVLLHCASGGRARTIWTAYLIKYEGLSEDEAVLRAQRAGQQPSSLDRLLGKPSAYVPPAEDE